MKPGIIFCGWGTRDLIAQSLSPWIELRRKGGCIICAVSVKFAGFEGNDDGTGRLLRDYWAAGDIDHVIYEPSNIPETTARGMAMQWLRDVGCDVSIQWDSDEVTDIESIQRMLAYVESEPFVAAFRFAYRNLVFDEHTWLADLFTPMRVHRMGFRGYWANGFFDDNNVKYHGTITRDIRQDISFSTATVPPTLFNPAHYTWLSNTPERAARSRAKIRYQTDRGWQCSFAWDDSKGLVFNPSFPEPKIVREA